MAEQKLNIFTNITKIAGYITATAVVVGMLWNTFKFVDTANKTTDQIKALSLKVDTLTSMINGLSTQGYRLGNMLIELTTEINTESDKNERYHNSYIKYLRYNTKTSQELFKYIEGLDLEVKKN